jgi:thiol-disulfide isomerase/thioredoxin
MRIRAAALLAILLLSSAARGDFNLSVKTEGVRLGPNLVNSVRSEDLKDRVVLLEFWGINCPPCLASLPKLAALNSELAPFGLMVVGAHAQDGMDEQVKRTALSRGVNFPIVKNASVEGGNDFSGIPHCMLFDHSGKCLYRGDPQSVETKLRLALGAALADTGSKADLAPPVAALAASLRKGTAPARVLRQAVALLKSSSKTTAGDARILVGRLTAAAQTRLDEANRVVESEPLRAYDLAVAVAGTFKGAPVSTEAAALAAKLKGDKAVAVELKARPALESIRKLDQVLGARALAARVDTTNPDFLKANRASINQLRTRLTQIKKTAPDAKATAEAATIAEKYGVTVK